MNLSNFISLSRSFIRAPLTHASTSASQRMRAAVLRPLRDSQLQVLSIAHDVPVPSIGAGDVLIRVHAASINPLDQQMRFGYAKSITGLKIDSPLILGRECSGVVEKEGDEIVAATAPFRQGSHAEDESEIARKPKNLTHVQSASLPFNALTAWNAISIAQINQGMKVLVLGGSGRVGFSLVSLLVRHFHCQVTTSCSPQNIQKILDLGVARDDVIEHANVPNLQSGFDAVFDVVGTAQSEAICISKLRAGGAYITFNGNLVTHADKSGVVGLAQGVLESTCKRVSMFRDPRGVRYGYALFSPSGSALGSLVSMAEKEVLVSDVGKTFPLENIEEAYQWNGSGKVVITMPVTTSTSKSV